MEAITCRHAIRPVPGRFGERCQLAGRESCRTDFNGWKLTSTKSSVTHVFFVNWHWFYHSGNIWNSQRASNHLWEILIKVVFSTFFIFRSVFGSVSPHFSGGGLPRLGNHASESSELWLLCRLGDRGANTRRPFLGWKKESSWKPGRNIWHSLST